jgi:hypothetical protein
LGSTIKSQALEDVIRKAGDEGILFVAAAGNDHSDNDAKPHYPPATISITLLAWPPSIAMTN